MSFFGKNKYYIILALTFGIMVYLEYSKPKPIDWTQTYSEKDKIPYGTYVLRKELKAAFPEKGIIQNNKSYYQFFEKEFNAPILVITNNFSPSKLDLDLILKHVEKGNDLFVAANHFSQEFTDTMGFGKTYNFIGGFGADSIAEFSFTNKKLSNETYVYKKAYTKAYFNNLDTAKTSILGNNTDGANFIKIEFGEGNIFINLEPLAFTNFSLLAEKNYQYPFKALSYLPQSDLIWDEYYKPMNSIHAKKTPMYFVLENPPLRYAWYILLLGMIIYILFEGKRRQRVIPVVEPPKNMSLEFIETVGKLYFYRGSHKDLAEKKFKYFAEYLRSNYFLKANKFSGEHYKRIAEKTGVSKNLISDIFNKYRKIASKQYISEDELFSLNKDIEAFYSAAKYK